MRRGVWQRLIATMRERPDVTPAPIVVASAGPFFQPVRASAAALQPDIGSALLRPIVPAPDIRRQSKPKTGRRTVLTLELVQMHFGGEFVDPSNLGPWSVVNGGRRMGG